MQRTFTVAFDLITPRFSAMHVGGEIDEQGNESPPSRLSFFLHFLSMPWKVLFAFTPTRNTYGGFPAFFFSMFLIGGVTAIIEQVHELSVEFLLQKETDESVASFVPYFTDHKGAL